MSRGNLGPFFRRLARKAATWQHGVDRHSTRSRFSPRSARAGASAGTARARSCSRRATRGRRVLHPERQGEGHGRLGARQGSGRRNPRSGRVLRRGMPGRAGAAHGDGRDDDGSRHHAAGKSGHRRVLHEEPAFSEMFIAHLLARTIRVEADLVDQLFNSSEKRLARLLLLLANFGKEGKPEPMIAKISQETLAEMIGTTRSRVSFFMNKFRKLGFIDYNGGIEVHSSLLNVILHDQPQIQAGLRNPCPDVSNFAQLSPSRRHNLIGTAGAGESAHFRDTTMRAPAGRPCGGWTWRGCTHPTACSRRPPCCFPMTGGSSTSRMRMRSRRRSSTRCASRFSCSTGNCA